MIQIERENGCTIYGDKHNSVKVVRMDSGKYCFGINYTNDRHDGWGSYTDYNHWYDTEDRAVQAGAMELARVSIRREKQYPNCTFKATYDMANEIYDYSLQKEFKFE